MAFFLIIGGGMSRYLVFFSMLFFGLSFLDPLHFAPWLTFISEMLVLVSCLLLILSTCNNNIILEKKSLLLLLIVLLPFIQYLFGILYYLDIVLINSIYIFLFLILIFIIKDMPKEDLNYLLRCFAFTLVLVGFISSLFAFFQFIGISKDFSFITSFSGSRPYANMAQPNNLATLLIIALIMSMYLAWKDSLNKFTVFILSICFLAGIVLTQSRTVWLFLLVAVAVFFIFRKKIDSINFKYIGLLCFSYIGMVIFLPDFNNFLQSFGFGFLNVDEVSERATSGFLRLEIWQQMLFAIKEKPLLGYGWNQTITAQYFVADKYDITEWVGNSHNLFLDMLVWNGVLIGSILILLILGFLIKIFKRIKSLDDLFFFLIVMCIFIHSMLEYPFSYGYFLFILAIALGVLYRNIDIDSAVKMNLKFYPVLIFLMGLVFSVLVWKDYMVIISAQKSAYDIDGYSLERELNYENINVLTSFDSKIKWILLDPKLKVNEVELLEIRILVENFPSTYNLIKYAQLLAYNGYQSEAKLVLHKVYKIHHKAIKYKDLFY